MRKIKHIISREVHKLFSLWAFKNDTCKSLAPESGALRPSLLITIALSLVPVLVFLLIPVSSDTRSPNDKSALRYPTSHSGLKFGSEQIDDESRAISLNNGESLSKSEARARSLAVAEEEDLPPGDFSQEASPRVVKSDEASGSATAPEKKSDTIMASDRSAANSEHSTNTGTSKLDELTTVLNVTDADIEALVKTFSKLTGRNYIVDSSVKGKVTIHLPTPITLSEALKVFDSVLLLRGFATVPLSDNIWKVISAKDAKQTTIPMIGSSVSTEESLVTEVLKSPYLSAEEIQKILSQFISRDGFSQAISGTNLILLVDSGSNIKRIKNLMREIDIPPMDQDISIIPIKHALAVDISEKINQILNNESEGPSNTPDNSLSAEIIRRRLAVSAAASSLQQPGQGPNNSSSAVRSNPSKIIPDERTNSLIVVADEFTTLKIQALVDQLDSEIDKSSGRFWVYRLEHADAEELSNVLSGLISGGGGVSGGSGSTQGSSATRNRQSGQSQSGGIGSTGGGLGGTGGSQGSRSRIQRSGSRSSGGGLSAGGGSSLNTSGIPGLGANSTRVTFQSEIAISPDIATNSLVINAEKADYDKLSHVIRALDVKRRQVIVEATILEVSLSDDQGLGIELQGTAATNSAGVFSQTNYGGLTELLTNPAGLSDLTIAAASSGTLTLPGGLVIPSQAALITAVSSHSNVNVLSAPTILSTDNQEAEIIVGENVPFVTSTGVNQVNLGNTFNQIQRQDVGITLRITPQIGTGDFLSLQIFVEISNVVPGTRNDPNGPTTTIRTTDTVVAVKNRQMIVTGGLIQDSVTESTRGVPYLQDVPVLGALFRRQDETKSRTNLLIFLTPQIIHDQYDLRDQTKLRSKNMSAEIEYLEAHPARSEVLENTSMDDVFEAPEEEKFENNIPLGIDRQEDIQGESNLDTPILPDPGSKRASIITEKKTDKVFSFDVQGQEHAKKTNLPQETYIVLQSVGDGKKSKLEMDSGGSLGLILPAPALSQKIFAAGSQYEKDGESFVCLGVYTNKDEAAALHGVISNWNRLPSSKSSVLEEAGWSFYE